MSEDEAYDQFKSIRWDTTGGKPVCPRCGCTETYEVRTRKIFKCQACARQFSATSGTIFASRKLPMRDLLSAIAIFVNGAKGHSALQMSRELGVDYKTAFVLAHKLREAMNSTNDRNPLEGRVEVDGAIYGGYIKPNNKVGDRQDRRLRGVRNGKAQTVVVMRERGGRTVTVVDKTEAATVETVRSMMSPSAIIYADEAGHWDKLLRTHDMRRINHKKAYAEGPVSTNLAESFHSRMRRAEMGTFHHICGPYFSGYAEEMAWRENNRRKGNGEQYLALVAAAAAHPVSRQWKGYWQRWKPTEPLISVVGQSQPDRLDLAA